MFFLKGLTNLLFVLLIEKERDISGKKTIYHARHNCQKLQHMRFFFSSERGFQTQTLLEKIKACLDDFETCSFSFNNRESNLVAHSLAQWAATSSIQPNYSQTNTLSDF